MSDFVAIDFETANEQRNSPCEVSLIRFSSGVESEKLTSLVFQERFSAFNTMLHGIDRRTVSKAPKFKELWPELREFIGSDPLVAHNAGFDMSVLFRALEGIPIGPDITYFCTMVLSRRMLDTTYFGLPGVAEFLEIDYPMDHRAENDAIAAGKVAMALLNRSNHSSLLELSEHLKVRPGVLTSTGPTGSRHVGFQSNMSASERNETFRQLGSGGVYEDPDFAGKRIVFTGALQSMNRFEAEIAIMKAGGIPVSSVSKKTNMVIFGYQDPRMLKGKPLSEKRMKAEELRAQGIEIEVVDEIQFLQMLEDPNALSI